MNNLSDEFEELRVSIERLRTMLENLVVRGLRACGTDEITQLQSHTQHLESVGAGHVAAVLAQLTTQIEKDDRASAQTLLKAQASVRLLERLLTLRVVRSRYDLALASATGESDPDYPEEEE